MRERTALIADIHGNTPALRAVLADVARAGCTRLFVLGDIINGLDPAGSVDCLQAAWPGAPAIKGNAEHYLLTPDLDAFPLRDEPMYAELIATIRWWQAQLSPAQIAWLRGLPDLIEWDGACLVHDSPLDRLFPGRWRRSEIAPQYQELCFHAPGLSAYTPQTQIAEVFAWMAERGVGELYCGHTHSPCLLEADGRRICNVGSVGLPLDGDPRAEWALLEREPGGASVVTIQHVPYNIDAALALVEQHADYPFFSDAARRAAYSEMLRRGQHWRRFLGSR